MTGLVGHGLATFTTDISIVRLSFPDNAHPSICFVDTPGFDDTTGSDIKMFRKITHWLSVTSVELTALTNSDTDVNFRYKKNIHLSGLLYFHRISDNRMAGSLLKNFHLFEQICGTDFNRIVLITTMWDQVDEPMGLRREQELVNIYWKLSIDRGSSVAKFQNTRVSAFEIVMPILKATNKSAGPLLLQKEMADKGLKLSETTAGKRLFGDPEKLITDHHVALQRIQQELKKPDITRDTLQRLTQEHKELAAQLPSRRSKRSLWKAGFQRFIIWIQRLR